MKCVYYTRPDNVPRILSTGIDPEALEHPDIATDKRYVNLFPLTLLEMTVGWRTFAWRYQQTHIVHWTPLLLDIPFDKEVAFRHWGSQELWSRKLVEIYDIQDSDNFLAEYPTEKWIDEVPDWDQSICESIGWDIDWPPDEIPDFRIGSRCAGLSVKFAKAGELEEDLRIVVRLWKPKLEDVASTDSEKLVTILGEVNVLFRGVIDKEMIAGIA